MKRKLEICCYTIDSALIAENAGADRIELCDNYSEGGTTPSYGTVIYCSQKLNIPINVIIRPRGGDFLYTNHEYEIIKHDVLKMKEIGINGIVIGFLNANGEIDIAKTEEIIELAYPLEITFHRAFDMCNNQMKALEDLKLIGVKRILTSGAMNTAVEGIELLSELVKLAGDEIIIMPGSGVNEKNINLLIEKTSALEYHCSAKTFVDSQMNYFNKNIYMGGNSGIDEFKNIIADSDKIKKIASIIKSFSNC